MVELQFSLFVHLNRNTCKLIQHLSTSFQYFLDERMKKIQTNKQKTKQQQQRKQQQQQRVFFLCGKSSERVGIYHSSQIAKIYHDKETT